MNIIRYGQAGIGVFLLAQFLTLNIVGRIIGTGVNETRLIVTAISLLTATLVMCTMVIVDTIRSIKPGE